MKYKILIISAALLVAPLAFAEDGNRGPGMPPPGGMMRGDVQGQVELGDQGERRGPGMMGSTTMGWNRPTTTPDGRPLPGAHNEGTTTNPGRGWGDKRGENYMMGTSTPPRPGIGNFFKGLFNFFGGRNDNGTSTASTSANVEASTSVEAGNTPPPAVIQFFQNFFSRFFSR